MADPIIEGIIGARIKKLSCDDLNKITYAHRLGMSAENILGLILEEYLSENLRGFGWHCAWGETVKSVDFVHESGRLLQIKNRSNSENSSSSAVRNGTEIEKWFRIKAGRIEYMWESLNEICGTATLSEESFVWFVRETISFNPGCLAVEPNNPWS
ncbi:MAG: SinI family restriction endonuclease [Gammaproteobacteria bacterium]|nr:SinI family restriction endonuclease [Gammaproteobacteria bacterium]MBQ0841142.1 SinI family restriction endonuclease [Gammaproteobacteria bacterium]